MKAKFSSEAEMCAAFIAALPEKWTAYPETAGFDILVVHRNGCQIGIEAKLALNAKVLTQALPSIRHSYAERPAPDFRAALVPDGSKSDLCELARWLGITVVHVRNVSVGRPSANSILPSLPDFDHDWQRDEWLDWHPATRIPLPDYVPDVQAGRSGPIKLTEWKVRAIKLAITLERRGYLTPADFTFFKVSQSRWVQPPGWSWLSPGEVRGRWVNAGRMPDFKAQHPLNYLQIEADYEKWKNPEGSI